MLVPLLLVLISVCIIVIYEVTEQRDFVNKIDVEKMKFCDESRNFMKNVDARKWKLAMEGDEPSYPQLKVKCREQV